VVSSSAISAETLRGFLKDSLPEYMIPAHLLVMDRLPTTPNGKLDRKALPSVTLAAPDQRSLPRDDSERAIAAIFSELLRVPEVSVFDNFFDLGGHSLLGTELVFRLRRELGLDLAVKTLFEAPTVASLAAFLRAPTTPSGASLPKHVVLARQGGGVPWFCFPALAGTAAPYLASIAHGAGPAVYLLEAPGLDGEPPLSSVEALAAAFSQAICEVAPTGPIRLLGWSFGALTAFATARLLSAEGRNLEHLVLVDPALPGTTTAELSERDLALAFLADIAESLGKLSELSALWAGQEARLREAAPADLFQLAQDVGVFSASSDPKDIEARFSVYTAGAAALRRFTLSLPEDVYLGKGLILAAREGNGQQTSRWLPFLPQSQLTVLEATHYTILRHLRELLQSSPPARDQATTRGFE
jgi:thioesterase domain-containing protein/acyl carrier protein